MALSQGTRLRLAREYHVPKFTQEQLGAILGIDRSGVSRLESSEHELPGHVLTLAAAALKVREAYFYDKDVDGPPFGYRITDPLPFPPTPDEIAEYRKGRSKAAGG